ncbi:MAG: putative 2-aminoethylphosphonate ABC transporter permease subunit, partial [Burkholderiales bacterium]|nr:putative 2-aminoethylphosphonate ABC transporter permease subunit [Burkholderiales bacterium]
MSAALPLRAPVPSPAVGSRLNVGGWPLVLSALVLVVFLLLPMGALLSHSVLDDAGHWSLQRFGEVLTAPGMADAAWNTFWVALVVTGITVPLAFLYAYAIQRSCMPFKGLWR